jgi:hypothetical protein
VRISWPIQLEVWGAVAPPWRHNYLNHQLDVFLQRLVGHGSFRLTLPTNKTIFNYITNTLQYFSHKGVRFGVKLHQLSLATYGHENKRMSMLGLQRLVSSMSFKADKSSWPIRLITSSYQWRWFRIGTKHSSRYFAWVTWTSTLTALEVQLYML